MPVGWQKKTDKIQERLAEEQAKLDAIQWQVKPVSTLPPVDWSSLQPQYRVLPQAPIPSSQLTMDERLPVSEDYTPPELPNIGNIIPQMRQTAVMERPVPILPQVQLPKPTPAPTKAQPVSVPFWQRALQVFAAPFDWVSETLIKPAEATFGTALGLVPELARQPGEDFFAWKKRSWAAWESPGIDVNVPWSKEPMRLDVRGVVEFAPWLLIPGVGQVGGGVRGAAGIAGMLGKLGTAGRIAGRVVEYSPWGLVEKTAGVAIKGGFRVAGNVSERVSTSVGEKLFGKYVPSPVPPEVTKLAAHFKETVMPSYRAFQKAKPALRARQEASLQAMEASYRRGEIPFERIQAERDIARSGGIKVQYALTPEALAARQEQAIADVLSRQANGEISEAAGKALITKIEKSPAYSARPFTETEVKNLHDMMNDAFQNGLVEAESKDAFTDLMFGQMKTLPERHNLRQWKTVFGDEFDKAVGNLGSPSRANQVVDALGISKSMVSMADMSGFGRQGLFFVLLHPTKIPRWFIKYGQSFLSEKLTLDMDDALRARPIAKIFQQGKTPGYLRPVREAPLALREEAYPAMAARIPFLRRSGRSFNAGLNEMSLDTFEAGYNAMIAQGATEAQIDLFRGFVNLAGGRGTLPKALEKYAPALNMVFFSPRLQAATLQLPRQLGRMLLSDNPYMRKEAAKALVTFVGGGSAVLGLLNATGKAKVETDPRSGDFAKIKIGETRLDIWRGYVQYARFAAQLLFGERKSAYGNMNKAERGEIAGRFIQSKMSPVAGLFSDIWRGENYQGTPLFTDTTGFSKIARERFLPLAVQDIIDAMEMNGVNGALVASPALIGIGALTYVNDFVKVKERIANEMGYTSWDDIDPKTQREIQNRSAELQAVTIAYDRQIMGTAWGDWRQAGRAIEDLFRQDMELATTKYRSSVEPNRGITFREKISDAWIARRGAYNVREGEERFADIVKRMKTQDIAESLVGLGPEGVAIRIYQDALYGEDMYDEFGDYRFDEANRRKQILRQQLGDEMFDYVEEYQAVRYQDLPQEFQDLQEAKKLMKPYWAVQDTVVRLFGQRFADSPAGQSLITRRRKQMRLQNPALNQAYTQFYAQQ